MIKSRILFHPILSRSISRVTLYIFLFLTICVTVFLWLTFKTCLVTAEIPISSVLKQSHPILQILLNYYVLGALIFVGVLFGTAYTAFYVVGPAHRIEEWLLCWQAGQELQPMKARSGDKYSELIGLLNALYHVTMKKNKNTFKLEGE